MISPQYFQTAYLYLILILTLFAANRVQRDSFGQIKQGTHNFVEALVLVLILSVWLGSRPPSGYLFGDSSMYAHQFYLMKASSEVTSRFVSEWVWANMMLFCAKNFDLQTYFTVIDLGYFGFMLWACKRLTPNNVLVTLLFCLAAFSTFSYGTNGLRNGLACSIMLVVFSYATGNTRDKIIAGVLAFFAFNIHRTTALPLLMMILSLTTIKSFKTAYTFWILSIVISVVGGSAVTALFTGLGFDDRMDNYAAMSSELADQFRHTGFRWDFLIYSMMPIVLGYYIVIKRGIQDKTYMMLLSTYTLANAFWVMVIRAAFSNRFAYLSWFMYPIVLAYPLLRLNVWGELQGKRLVQIMWAHAGFTWFMQTIYY